MLLQDRQDSSRSSPPLRNKFLIEQNHQIVKSESMALSAAHAAALLETQRQIETMIDGLECPEPLPRRARRRRWRRDLCGFRAAEAIGLTPKILQGECTEPAVADFATVSTPLPRRAVRAEILNYTKQGRTFHHCLETTRVRDASDGVDYFCTESFERDTPPPTARGLRPGGDRLETCCALAVTAPLPRVVAKRLADAAVSRLEAAATRQRADRRHWAGAALRVARGGFVGRRRARDPAPRRRAALLRRARRRARPRARAAATPASPPPAPRAAARPSPLGERALVAFCVDVLGAPRNAVAAGGHDGWLRTGNSLLARRAPRRPGALAAVAPTARGARLLAAVFDLAARADASPALARAAADVATGRGGLAATPWSGPRSRKLRAGGTVEATAQRQEEDDDDDSDDEPRTATSTTLNKVVLLDAAAARRRRATVPSRRRATGPAPPTSRGSRSPSRPSSSPTRPTTTLAAAAAFGAASSRGPRARSRVAFGHQPTLVSAVVDAVAFGRRGAAVDGLWRLAATRNDEAALSLFCVAYSQRLLTMDDETLLAQGTGTIAAVVAKLRDFLYETLWVGQVLQAQEPAACGRLLLVAAAARLLSHLRDRVGRAPGLDGDDLWRWRDVRLSERLAEDSAAPRGLVLAAVPFVVPFVQRVALFQALVDGDRRAHQSDAAAALAAIRPLGVRAKVRRDALFDDSMAALADLPADQLNATDGALYAGGGARDASTLRKYEFCGRVIAKALERPRGARARFFLNKALGKYNYFDDLRSLDAGLYAQLSRLKNLDDADLAALDLRFEVTSSRTTASTSRRGGLGRSSGLRAVVPERWLKMFDAEELQTLVSGDDRPLDVEDWRAHAHYGGGYHPSQPIIAWFWEVVAEFSAEDRAGLLRFITSCSRPPLLGFKCLNPLISIHKVQIASDEERLPTAGTCMNLLKLPNYSSKAALKEKLLYSIRNAHGFELS
ncbi:ubiquitin-protein transferase [Aureococcus anophagefferens]|nr:ubiquitin-protein transferase [Aureococcus anophagefferens]